MNRHVTAYELVLSYRDQYAALPTVGVELQELRFYADANGYDMPPDDDLMAVCHQMRTRAQPATGQGRLF